LKMRTPTVDFDENDKEFQLTVNLPGFKKEEVKVDVRQSQRICAMASSTAVESKKGSNMTSNDPVPIRIGEGNWGTWGLIPSVGDWSPFGLLSNPYSNVGSLFNAAASDLWPQEQLKMRTPTVDFDENDKEFQLTVNLPGFKKEEVKVDVRGRVLTMTAEAKKEERTPGFFSRSYGAFSRQLCLPEHAKVDGVKAMMENGQLKVLIPKEAPLPPTQRAISIE